MAQTFYNNEIDNSQCTDRVIWGDLLRIFASIMVVGIHTAGQYYYVFDEKSAGWWVAIIIDSLGWFAVPSFLMLSGMLMLNPQRNVTYKSIAFHSIPKMVGIILYSFLITSAIWFIRYRELVFKSDAPTHTIFWIMLMYLFTPALREVVKSRKVLKNSILILMVLSVIASQFVDVPHVRALSAMLYSSKDILYSLLFYLLGYYLATENVRIKWPLLLLGVFYGYIVNFIFMYVGLDKLDSVPIVGKLHMNSAVYFPQIVISCAMFLLFKEYGCLVPATKRIVRISKSTMYIYMSHIAVRDILMQIPISDSSRFAFLKVPFYIFFNVLISYFIAICFMKVLQILKRTVK